MPKLLISDINRLKSYIRINQNGCWEWQGKIDKWGYGHTRIKGKNKLAHRAMYELCVAMIPVGLVTDHKCKNRCCINPSHIEIVTPEENSRRSHLINGQLKTHCKSGHEFNFKNTYFYKNRRICRTCNNLAEKKYKRRRA